jgi:hypothetical protein
MYVKELSDAHQREQQLKHELNALWNDHKKLQVECAGLRNDREQLMWFCVCLFASFHFYPSPIEYQWGCTAGKDRH